MRDAVIFILIFGSIPFIFKRPAVGVMVYACVSLMNPHRLAYGAAYLFPFALLICVTTLLSLIASKEAKKLPGSPVPVMMIILFSFMTLTCLLAKEQDAAWTEWNRVVKTYLMVLITICAIRTGAEVRALAWTVGLSVGFWGIKGGVFTILSGGSSHVLGPAGSYISDNNTIALSQVTVLPILWFMMLTAKNKWIKRACLGAVVLTFAAVIGTYSRGALLGGAAMVFFLWLKSGNKFRAVIVLALLAPLIFMAIPEKWLGRMETIDNYQEDTSAMGRINAWQFAINVATANPLGGGFGVFSRNMFSTYAPDPDHYHVAHSIYFQVLGEHGFLGLLLFLGMLFGAWRTGSKVIRFCQDKPDLAWARALASMCQVSMIGYMVCGAFLTLAYYDLPYYIYALMALLDKVLIRHPQPADALPAGAPAQPGLPRP
ncbi:putative O-glycosylation ligase, exosortase A system-associated [Pseudoduganella namucuonensis]|uniref:Probable O-glycosylation ligase, exosortase A-associated n=1 Tax=Pseudoduganella namucuonensis TaxID=1035707 RepID=A0A1I7GES4_9BURK|nr:putative O-glycosylation ligase, exosortase A system-associated [Pseudoduganella namucuonensis]SFU46954.1 probable O-glycosylation ligase, exosortase A-associated [Pseudoduganella namucuonensis]